MIKLVSGPTTVISSSARGERGSPRMCAMPPKMNSVIPATGTPFARPTRACDSSCARTDRKNMSAAIAPMAQLNLDDQSGWCAGNRPPPRLMTISQKTMSRLQSTRTSTPAIRPTRKPTGCGHPLSMWRWFAPYPARAHGAAAAAEPRKGGALRRRRRARLTTRPTPSSRADSAVVAGVVGARRGSPSSNCTFRSSCRRC